MRWNESHSASRLPPILLCCLPLPRRFPHALSTPSESLFHSGSPLSSLPSTVPPFSSFIKPQPSFSYPLQHVYARSVRARYTHVHTCSRTYGSKVFARGGQYSPTTRTTPSRPGVRGRRGADGRGDTILPSCRGRDIFSLSRDNLETGVALPARESSEGERLGPGQNAPLPMPPVHPHSTLFC